MSTIIEHSDLAKIAEEINTISAKLAQETFMKRRILILAEVSKLTGQDYANIIPAIRKGRPAKVKATSALNLVDTEQVPD